MNILLVDDNASIRDNTADWFRMKGHTVLAVPCAFAARDIIRNGQAVDAMILDLQLPCGQGNVITSWLLSGGADGIPLVVWTAKAKDDVNLPQFRVVFKPCSFEVLEQALMEEVDKEKHKQESQHLF